MTNDKRFLKIEEKDFFSGLVADFETQLDIESQNIWKAGTEFEITMIKAAIQSFPSNSDEGQKILIQFIRGLVKSVLTMSPTDDLIDSLIQGAKFLHQSYKIQDLKKKYEVYYYFESLKWYMIQLLKQDVDVKRVLQLLRNAFQNYITIIEGQSKPIRAMQFQPVSQILASLNEKENIIHLWDVKTKKYSAQPDGHNLEVNLVGFSPDGKIIFSWGKDEQIKLWSILEGKHCKSLKNIKNCIGIEFSHQGEFLLIQSDFNYIWYYIEGRVITLNKPQGSLPVAKMNELHTNGDLLVIVEKFSKQYSIQKANLKFMDLKLKQETNKMIEANSSDQILKFSKNGELLVYKFYSQILTYNLKLNQEFLIKKDTDQIQLSQNGQMIL